MNVFRFILFVLALCFSGAYWWYCYENGITEFIGIFLDEDSFFAKFLSLVLLAATIGLVVWAFVSWLSPLLPPSDIQTVIQEAEQSGVVFE